MSSAAIAEMFKERAAKLEQRSKTIPEGQSSSGAAADAHQAASTPTAKTSPAPEVAAAPPVPETAATKTPMPQPVLEEASSSSSFGQSQNVQTSTEAAYQRLIDSEEYQRMVERAQTKEQELQEDQTRPGDEQYTARLVDSTAEDAEAQRMLAGIQAQMGDFMQGSGLSMEELFPSSPSRQSDLSREIDQRWEEHLVTQRASAPAGVDEAPTQMLQFFDARGDNIIIGGYAGDDMFDPQGVPDRNRVPFEARPDDEVYGDGGWPEEFTDPIAYCLINIPMELPGSKKVVDRDIILRHLHSSETDPFSRQPLTLEVLEQYNMDSTVRSAMETLKCRIDEWKRTVVQETNQPQQTQQEGVVSQQ